MEGRVRVSGKKVKGTGNTGSGQKDAASWKIKPTHTHMPFLIDAIYIHITFILSSTYNGYCVSSFNKIIL